MEVQYTKKNLFSQALSLSAPRVAGLKRAAVQNVHDMKTVEGENLPGGTAELAVFLANLI